MTTIAVIPARYASSRFPGKPLANQTGKYLIQHVCECVGAAACVDRVIVATDDQRIMAAVGSFGGEAMMTRADHTTGTNRVAEVADSLGLDSDDLVLNVQGDEPELDPAVLDLLAARMADWPASVQIGTLAAPFDDAGPRDGAGSPLDPNCVKVVVDDAGRAMYFSRSLIPYARETGGVVGQPSRWLLHLGVYAFRAGTLRRLTTIRGHDSTALDSVESLEQLRWLAAGVGIGVCVVGAQACGVDTAEDYAAFVTRNKAEAAQR